MKTLPRCSRFFFLSALLLQGFLPVAAKAAALDPQTYVSKADVAKVVGSDVQGPSAMPEGTDDDLGARQVVNIYKAGDMRVLVVMFTFPSAAAAAKLTKARLAELIDEENPKAVKVVEESGVGDRAFWSMAESGVGYTVVKGKQVLALALVEKLPRAPASYHDALRALALSVAAKL